MFLINFYTVMILYLFSYILFVRPIVIPDALPSSLSFTFRKLGKCQYVSLQTDDNKNI